MREYKTIPSRHAGAVIGPGGERIKHVRVASGAQITLTEGDNPAERLIILDGTPAQIGDAERLLQENILMFGTPGLAREPPREPNRSRRRPAIEPYRNHRESDRNRREPDRNRREPDRNRREPDRNRREGIERDDDKLMSTQSPVPNQLAGAIIGKGGDRINQVRTATGAQISLSDADRNDERIMTIEGTRRQIEAAQRLIQENIRVFGERELRELQGNEAGDVNENDASHGENVNEVTSTQVTVPDELSGILIGRNGDRIKEIRNASGARVEFSERQGDEDRVVTIIGTPSEIYMAQFLMQERIRDSESGRRYLDHHVAKVEDHQVAKVEDHQ